MSRTICPSAARHLCLALWIAGPYQLAACSPADEQGNGALDGSDLDGSTPDDATITEGGTEGGLEVGPAGDGSNIPDGLVFDGPWDASDANQDGGDGGADGSADGSQDAPTDVADAQDDGDAADAGGQNRPICYFGDFDTNGTHVTACLAFPGPVRNLLDVPGIVGDWIESVAMSPGGEEVAVAVREHPNSRFKILVVRLDHTAPPRELLDAPSPVNEIAQLAYSVDGTRLAFLADFDEVGTRSLYAVVAAGGAAIQVSPQAEAGKNVTGFAWAPTATPGTDWLAYRGDVTTDGVHGLWKARVALPMPQSVPIFTETGLGTNGDVQGDIAWDADGDILFRSNHGPGGVLSLYRATLNGEVEIVPGTSMSNGLGKAIVSSFGLSPDGMSVAFSANSPEPAVFEVYVVGLGAGAEPPQRVSALPVVSEAGTLSGPAFQTPIAWSPDGTLLTVVADWRLDDNDRDDSYSAFVLPGAEPAGGWRVLGSPQAVDLNARDARFSESGSNLIVRGDLVSNGAFELFVVANPMTPDQNPLNVRFEPVPSLGDVVGLATDP